MEKLKEWWNKLSTQEKIALVLVVAGVAGYALYRRNKNSQSVNNAPNGGASVGQAVDQYGNPLYPTNLSGLYSTQPGGTFSSNAAGSNITSAPLATIVPFPDTGKSSFTPRFLGPPVSKPPGFTPRFLGPPVSTLQPSSPVAGGPISPSTYYSA